jgi:hypothetical protein
MKNRDDCSHFEFCSCNICPLDPDKAKRNWIPGEEVCHRSEFKHEPYIVRMWKLNRTRPLRYESQALSYDFLVETAPVKKVMTDEQKAQAAERLKAYQFKKATA